MHLPDLATATNADPLDVAIIGGGAAGVLAAIHLLRASGGRIRLCVIEPRPLLGEGAAYSTRDPGHLLNVTAAGMSAFDDDPGHFVRHLASSGTTVTGADAGIAPRFVPRLEYGRYLRGTLAEHVAIESVHVRDVAVDVTGSAPGTVRLGSGRTIRAGAIVMALGNFPRSLPVDGVGEAAAAIDSAWDYPAIAAMPPESDVCIIGAGLSMVDAVASLAANRHRGRIRVLSRHGLVPLAHAPSRGPVGNVDDLLALGVRARLRALRARADAGMRDGTPWQWTMDGLRPHGQRLWQSLDDREQRRFLRHAHRFWDIHRHRIAPEVATRIDALRRSRQLTVHAGRVASVSRGPTAFEVVFRPRGGATQARMQAHRVLLCAGIETRLEHMPGALLAALAARGTVAPGPHGLGLAVSDAGALVAADGTVQPLMLAIGSARIGHDWETTAIPELRGQARAISERLLDAPIEAGAI